jgi:hypothetical protein
MVAVANQSTSFSHLLARPDCTPSLLASHLDGLDAATRVAESRGLSSAEQARLWEVCKDAPAFTAEDLVPSRLGEGKQVIWYGKNTLAAFKIFEKRFMRVGGKVVGYNKQSTSFLTGPGYFTIVTSPHEPRELRVDYTEVPSVTPPGWPTVKANKGGFKGIVYGNLYDYLRRVSKDVCIGYATRLDKPINSWFILARE